MWIVSEETHIYTLNHLFDAVPALYIADGHHRTAAAIRYGQARRAATPDPSGDEPFESFMAVVFPHNQLKIMDYNRIVKDLNGLTSEAFLAALAKKFTVAPSATRSSRRTCWRRSWASRTSARTPGSISSAASAAWTSWRSG